MEFDLGMAMAIPFPIFSNPTYTRAGTKDQPKENEKAKEKGKMQLEEDQGFVSDSEESFPGSPELKELQATLEMFRTEDAILKASGMKDSQWEKLKEGAKKGRGRADSAVHIEDVPEDPVQEKKSIFTNAANIINRLTGNLDPKELHAVTQTSLEKFYSSMRELQTAIDEKAEIPSSDEHCSAPCSPRLNEVNRVEEDDSGEEFRHLFDELQTKDGFLATLLPSSLRTGIWNAVAGYIKQIFGGYMGYLEMTAKAIVPKSLSFLIWPALSYLVVLVFIGILSRAVIVNNWERVKDDAQALLDLLKMA